VETELGLPVFGRATGAEGGRAGTKARQSTRTSVQSIADNVPSLRPTSGARDETRRSAVAEI
jgi:hypothetical protein